jgi:hypothetical protein
MDNKKIVISFDEGCSGNFLASLLSKGKIFNHYRIDSDENFINHSIFPKFSNYQETYHNIIVTHENDIDKIKEVFESDVVIRIHPITGLFTSIYNVFMKKHINEGLSDILKFWPERSSYCYDMTMEHLKDYYGKFTSKFDFKDAVVLDFGTFYNNQRLLYFLKKFNIEETTELNQYINNYITAQMPLLLDIPESKSMIDIVNQIPDFYFKNNPWFACYCIFCFELKNNLSEGQRTWTIDQLPIIDKTDLIILSSSYI